MIRYVEDRLGHDRRYAIDSSKIQAQLGWEPKHTFETGIRETINWYKANQTWIAKVTGKYDEVVANEQAAAAAAAAQAAAAVVTPPTII